MLPNISDGLTAVSGERKQFILYVLTCPTLMQCTALLSWMVRGKETPHRNNFTIRPGNRTKTKSSPLWTFSFIWKRKAYFNLFMYLQKNVASKHDQTENILWASGLLRFSMVALSRWGLIIAFTANHCSSLAFCLTRLWLCHVYKWIYSWLDVTPLDC